MEPCYTLSIDVQDQHPQTSNDTLFIGGTPRIPADESIPECELCGAELVFFFQAAFPEKHTWNGWTMALFACISCEHEGYAIPPMLDGPLKDINIPKDFLKTYQRNFRILIFPTSHGSPKSGYSEKVKFKRWVLQPAESHVEGSKIGGEPTWLLDDESPATYDNHVDMTFLMQISIDFEFEKLPEAPPQFEIGLDGAPDPSNLSYYELFLQNQLYFFGATGSEESGVYILTQIE